MHFQGDNSVKIVFSYFLINDQRSKRKLFAPFESKFISFKNRSFFQKGLDVLKINGGNSVKMVFVSLLKSIYCERN